MIWVAALCGITALLIAPAVALFEARRLQRDPDDVGFWVFARAVAGSCHVRWGRGQSPIVRLPLPGGARGRARAVSLGKRSAVEVRAFLPASAGFAARVCAPASEPSRWHAPGLAALSLEEPLEPPMSLEGTHADRLERLLARPPVREALAAVAAEGAVELRVNGATLSLRVTPSAELGPGAAIQALGGGLVEALRVLTREVGELAEALAESGEAPSAQACPACGGALADDPWLCPACGGTVHRGCREMIEGCANPACRLAVDAPPAAVEP